MLKVAAAAPIVLGLKTTLIVQLPLTATEDPQLLVCENGCGLVVDSEMLLMDSGTAPLLVTLTDIGVLALLSGSLPNARDVFDTEKVDNSPRTTASFDQVARQPLPLATIGGTNLPRSPKPS